MSELRKGMVAKVFSKDVKPGFTLHSISLVDDDTYYGTHTTAPLRGDGSPLQEGDLVQFSCEDTKYGTQIVAGTLKSKAGNGPPRNTKSGGTKGAGKEDFAARAQYWEEKEKYDKEVTSQMINYRSSHMQATTIVLAALDKGILPVAGKAKDDKFQSVLDMIDKVKFEVYRDLTTQAKALAEGNDPALSASEIEPLTDDVLELQELESPEDILTDDSFGDDDWDN